MMSETNPFKKYCEMVGENNLYKLNILNGIVHSKVKREIVLGDGRILKSSHD